MKDFKKCPKTIQEKIVERLDLFVDNPSNPILNGHQLIGEFKGVKSFDVTGDYRVLYTEDEESGEIVLLLLRVGTHSQLY